MRAWVWLLPVAVLTACGGADHGGAPASAPTSAPVGLPAQAEGTVDPLAITSFTCRQNAKGRWKVSGTLTNSGKQPRHYRVTAFIGRRTGPARTVELPRVAPGAEVEFTVRPVVAAPDGPCRLQALQLH